MDIGELHAALGAVINGNPKAKNLDCFVSIDFGDGKNLAYKKLTKYTVFATMRKC